MGANFAIPFYVVMAGLASAAPVLQYSNIKLCFFKIIASKSHNAIHGLEHVKNYFILASNSSKFLHLVIEI